MTSSLPSSLPTELVLHILEFTCTLSHEAALHVSVLSSWARRLAKPYVFSAIVRRAGSLYPVRGQVELSHKEPPPGCGEYVRHLWLETVDVLSSPREMCLFKACPNVEDIAVSINSFRTLLSFYANPYEHPGSSSIRSLTLINHTPRTVWLVRPIRAFLDNVTHLRMVDMQQSTYIPLEHLPNLTHLALPYMHLRASHADSLLRLPDNIFKCLKLNIIILSVDHYDWLYRPWLHRGRYTAFSLPSHADTPRDKFRMIRDVARTKDNRIYVVLSPSIGIDGTHRTICAEWVAAARGEESIWEKAVRQSKDNQDLELLPTVWPKPRAQDGLYLWQSS